MKREEYTKEELIEELNFPFPKVGNFDVFINPLPYRGDRREVETGYVYAPYVPIFSTPTVVLEDFKERGFKPTYGKRQINPLFYVTGETFK